MKDEAVKQQLVVKIQEEQAKIARSQSNIAAYQTAIIALEGGNIVQVPTTADSLKKLILHALKNCPYEFTVRDVEKIINIQYTDNGFSKASIASAFWKLMDEMKFVVVKEGAGNLPTIYRKPLILPEGMIGNEENYILQVLNGPNGLGKFPDEIAAETNMPITQVLKVLKRRPEMFAEGVDNRWRKTN